MGTPIEIGDAIARDLAGLNRRIKQAKRDIAIDAAKVAREEHRATAAAATGGDGSYSGFGAAGRLSIRTKYTEDGVEIIPKGVWKVAEEGTSPHGHHPGTRRTQGKKAWSKAEEATVKRLDRTVPETFDRAIEEANRA